MSAGSNKSQHMKNGGRERQQLIATNLHRFGHPLHGILRRDWFTQVEEFIETFATYLLVKTMALQQMQWFYETYSKLFQVVLSCVVGEMSTWSEPQIQVIKVKSAQPQDLMVHNDSFGALGDAHM